MVSIRGRAKSKIISTNRFVFVIIYMFFPFKFQVLRSSIAISSYLCAFTMAISYSYSRSRAIFFISMTLLQLLSFITVILYSLTLAFISNPIVGLSQVINFDRQSFPVLQVLPETLNTASAKLALASGVLSLVVSSACVIFAVFFWPDEKRVRIYLLLNPHVFVPLLFQMGRPRLFCSLLICLRVRQPFSKEPTN